MFGAVAFAGGRRSPAGALLAPVREGGRRGARNAGAVPRRFVIKRDVLQQPCFKRQKGGRFCNLCHNKNKSRGMFSPCNLAKKKPNV